ncbi:hypothetical protein ACLWBD_03040 [Bdellovibrio sp. HCB117]|uniref:hypothetical protein n=1 Tax=Bdellovibrio sp. HCB117 TaxID=3394359 RepID=UPI0039B53B10
MKISVLFVGLMVVAGSALAQVKVPDFFKTSRERCDFVLRYMASTPDCRSIATDVCPPGSGMDAASCAVAIGNIKCDQNRNETLYRCKEECSGTADVNKCH